MINLKEGWNLIGVTEEIDITNNKDIQECYRFENGIYKLETVLKPNIGYWVRVLSSTKINSKINFNKHALFILGNVNYFGHNLTSHHKVAEDTKEWLINERGYNSNDIKFCSNSSQVKNEIKNLFKIVSQPYNKVVLWYTGHAIQVSGNEKEDYYDDEYWQHGMISDNVITNLINNTHEYSEIIIIADNCFSDGMVDTWKLNKKNWLFISASREKGKDEYTSEFFTGDGGFMTFSLINSLGSKESYTRNELLDLFDDKYWKDPTGNILHKPVVLPKNSSVKF